MWLNELMAWYLKKSKTFPQLLRFLLKKYALRIAAIQDDKIVTYQQISQQTESLLVFLQANANPAETVAFYAPNTIEYYAIRTAAHLGGFRFLALPPHFNQEEVACYCNKAEARILFYGGRLLSPADCTALSTQTKIACFMDLAGLRYQEIINKAPTIGAVAAVYSPEAIATLNLTSGTTGSTHKLIQMSFTNWSASLYNVILNAKISINTKVRYLQVAAFPTSGSTNYLPCLLVGVTNVIVTEKITPAVIYQYITKHQINRLYLSCSILLELMEWCLMEHKKVNLDNIIIGTERISPAKLKQAVDVFGPIITVGYGMAEVLPPVSMLLPEDYYQRGCFKEIQLDTVGRLAKGVELRILDPDGREVSPGQTGRIVIKGETVTHGYLGDAAATQQCFKDGCFYSADYGYLDQSGFLHILGRQEEILIADDHGQPRLAKDLEDIIEELPFVRRGCAIKRESKIILYVTLRETAEHQDKLKAEIFAYLAKRLVNAALNPAEINFIKEMPLTVFGKLNRKDLSRLSLILFSEFTVKPVFERPSQDTI